MAVNTPALKANKQQIDDLEARLQGMTIALSGLHQVIDNGQHDIGHIDISAVEKIFDDLHSHALQLLYGDNKGES